MKLTATWVTLTVRETEERRNPLRFETRLVPHTILVESIEQWYPLPIWGERVQVKTLSGEYLITEHLPDEFVAIINAAYNNPAEPYVERMRRETLAARERELRGDEE